MRGSGSTARPSIVEALRVADRTATLTTEQTHADSLRTHSEPVRSVRRNAFRSIRRERFQFSYVVYGVETPYLFF